jgi:hypothetical protein
MQLVRRLRIPALFCAFTVLLCELIARPYANMGISDDAPYILMARTLATTGHIVYNGWPAAMLGWQLYLGAAFIKLFGFTFTSVRCSTLLIAVLTSFILQRTLVRGGVTERNATLGTLALVLSPLYLMLSVTFLSDIFGLFAIVICLYACLRSLQAATSTSAIYWLCFAVSANAFCGTARQIAWLGTLVMVPSTLWLLRANRRVLIAGSAATLAGALFILGCMHWFAQQPYIQPEHLLPTAFPISPTLWRLVFFLLDGPFLLLSIVALFLLELRKSSSVVIIALLVGYCLVAVHPHHVHHVFLLEPTSGQGGDWVGVHGVHEGLLIHGSLPVLLHTKLQILLTILSFGGLLGLIASLIRTRKLTAPGSVPPTVTWKQLGLLLAPFSCIYFLLLIPRATENMVFDRYWLPLLALALLPLVRYYQEQIRRQLPLASIVLVASTAFYGVIVTHNMFSLYRARVTLASQLRSNGIPDTSVDNGFEYNFAVELQHAAFINDYRIVRPANTYVPTPFPIGTCSMWWYDKTPHIHPLYGVSFDPNACDGLAPIPPVQFSRWPNLTPGTLYVVRFTSPSQQ